MPLDKKKEILKAASECFARFGYEKTTLDDIGGMIGLNKASIYHYYKNKEAIYGDVILNEYEDAMQMLHSKIEEMPGCREKIITYVREKIRVMQHLINVNILSIEMCRNAQPAHSSLYKQYIEKEIDFLNEIMLDCIKHGEMKACDTKRIAKMILTVMDAVKMEVFQGIDALFVDKVDTTAWEDEGVFAVSIIIDGLIKKDSQL